MIGDTHETQTTGPLSDNAAKNDYGKLRWVLMPWDALSEVVRVLMFGASRYGRNNWTQGMAHTRFSDAAIRHIIAWQHGQDRDEESGVHHLAHAACGLLFLVAYSLRGIGTDDR